MAKNNERKDGIKHWKEREGEEKDLIVKVKPAEKFTIFVGNLGFKATENDIKDFFKNSGGVSDVRLGKHDDGKVNLFF